MSALAIGLMSGTSLDGMDAALVEITGFGTDTKVKLVAFCTYPYGPEFRQELLCLASGKQGGSMRLSRMNFVLGQISRDACLEVCRKAGVEKTQIAFIGSHGHTFYHEPFAVSYFDHLVSSTLQLGEASLINEEFNCPVVSDFRVRDVAAGGQGAPLVPYTEYLLYRSNEENIALQNIGGIGNITSISKSCSLEEVFAFDTGPGNMIIDSLVKYYSKNNQFFDDKGAIARRGNCNKQLLSFLLQDPYLEQELPKSTGREYYNEAFVSALIKRGEELNLKEEDVINTATVFTAYSIKIAIDKFFKTSPD